MKKAQLIALWIFVIIIVLEILLCPPVYKYYRLDGKYWYQNDIIAPGNQGSNLPFVTLPNWWLIWKLTIPTGLLGAIIIYSLKKRDQ